MILHSEFIAQIVVVNHPNEIRSGYTPVVFCHNAHITCKFIEIISKVDKKTGVVLEENPKGLKKGESGLVRMIPLKLLCIETFQECPMLARIAVVNINKVIAVGVVKSLVRRTTD